MNRGAGREGRREREGGQRREVWPPSPGGRTWSPTLRRTAGTPPPPRTPRAPAAAPSGPACSASGAPRPPEVKGQAVSPARGDPGPILATPLPKEPPTTARKPWTGTLSPGGPPGPPDPLPQPPALSLQPALGAGLGSAGTAEAPSPRRLRTSKPRTELPSNCLRKQRGNCRQFLRSPLSAAREVHCESPLRGPGERHNAAEVQPLPPN